MINKPLCIQFMLLFFFNFIVQGIGAQSLLVEIPLKQQIEKSVLVVEGRVISKAPFWDANDGLIYTAHTIEVYKVFKGVPVETIEVITLGGTVGLKALVVHPSLKLQNGDTGVFTLIQSDSKPVNQKSISGVKAYKAYSSVQGFYKYNRYQDIAVNPFQKKQSISQAFYNEIMKYTHTAYVSMSDLDFQKQSTENKLKQAKAVMTPSAITLNKSQVTAGTKEVLTITGSSFGVNQGEVRFANADDGGNTSISALDSQVLTWSDTEITVEVPSNAGTGVVFIVDSNNQESPRSETLTILYAEINAVFDIGSGDVAASVQHIQVDTNGGYIWEMQTDFFDDTEHPGARASFEKAFNEWVCQTGINWVISDVATSIDVIGNDNNGDNDADVSDGTNVIRFANTSELGAGVLGACISWLSGCIVGSTINGYVSELDIIFNTNINWHFGSGLPAGNQIDFESVALHELGHGHQLAHVIDTDFNGNNMDDVMHFGISFGVQQKVLNSSNISAATNIQSRSTTASVCGRPRMTDAACSVLNRTNEEVLRASVGLYPNPATDLLYIKNESNLKLKKLDVFDLSGRLVFTTSHLTTSPIHLVDVAKGMYVVTIYSETGSLSKKLAIR